MGYYSHGIYSKKGERDNTEQSVELSINVDNNRRQKIMNKTKWGDKWVKT